MPEYSVWGRVTVSCFCLVDAKNEREAMEKANALNMGGLCHNACSDNPHEAWVVSELDGTPEAVEAGESDA